MGDLKQHLISETYMSKRKICHFRKDMLLPVCVSIIPATLAVFTQEHYVYYM